MKANKEHNYFENKLDRQFDVKEQNTVFVTDITYLIYGTYLLLKNFVRGKLLLGSYLVT